MDELLKLMAILLLFRLVFTACAGIAFVWCVVFIVKRICGKSRIRIGSRTSRLQ
jgi:hypothetical protein